MKIGQLEIQNNLVLAPMAGVTDLPFRSICREMGCGLLYTEMVSVKAILYKNKNTDVLLEMTEDQHPIAVQLFGSDPEIMGDMAAKLERERDFDIIDINMGCPVPKVVNNHEGSALMKDPVLVEKILKNIVSKVSRPVTVKIRKGFDEKHVNATEIAKLAEQCGVSAVAVHGRTREQYYAGKADYQIIAEVKKSVNIPVIGNGDVSGIEDAVRLYEETGCDAIMIGRGARGNPWIFRELSEYFRTGRRISRPDTQEIREMILRHARMLIDCKGEYTGIHQMRKHVAWYTGGMPHSSVLRSKVNMVETYEQLESLMNLLVK